MKKYVSAIMIPCLLQFIGCYSLNEITLEDLKNEDEAIITTRDSSIYYLTKEIDEAEVINKPDSYFSVNWLVKSDEEIITLITQRSIKVKESSEEMWQIKKDTISIKYQNIEKAEVEKFNTWTLLLGIGIAATVIIVFHLYPEISIWSD